MQEDEVTGTRTWRGAYDLAKFTIIALLIITPFRFFVAQPFIVSGASMTPTIDPKEYLVIDEISYRFDVPERGDVVIFKYPLDPAVYFVKRVIGLPGEKIEIKRGEIAVTKESGERISLPEPYLGSTQFTDTMQVTLGTDEYFVLGDNREASSDSRVWGPLHKRYIVGRAAARLYPFDEFGLFPGKHEFIEREE